MVSAVHAMRKRLLSTYKAVKKGIGRKAILIASKDLKTDLDERIFRYAKGKAIKYERTPVTKEVFNK